MNPPSFFLYLNVVNFGYFSSILNSWFFIVEKSMKYFYITSCILSLDGISLKSPDIIIGMGSWKNSSD